MDLTHFDIHLKFHHLGCLTKNIAASLEIYKLMGFSKASEIFTVKTQNVKVCFIEFGNNTFLELVEFSDDSPALKKIFESKNPYYHVGYLVENLKPVIVRLEEQGFYLVNTFVSEAFEGRSCAFLYTPEMQLIELIEA